MANFIVTTDGKTYLNLDHAKYIRQVTVIDDIALIVLTDNCGVYQVSAADWLRHVATFDTPEVSEETPDNHLVEHRGSSLEVGATRKTPGVNRKANNGANKKPPIRRL